MEVRYRVLQARWPDGGTWQDWGFFYEYCVQGRWSDVVRCHTHANLDEFGWIAHRINERISNGRLRLEQAEQAIVDYSDCYRVLPEIHTYVTEGTSLAGALNAIEARILHVEHNTTYGPEQEAVRIFAGRANRPLAHAVARWLGLPLSAVRITTLPDSEIHVQLEEAVRRKDVFVIQPCSVPVNDHLIELLLMVDAFRRASANSITAVVPYFPYARQERMAHGREALSARVVASMLENVGVDRVICVDIHAEAIQGFFTIPVDPLQALPIMVDYFRRQPFLEDAVVVSPDLGRARLAGRYAQALGVPLVIMHKRRDDVDHTEVTHLVGDVRDKIPIVVDDVIASGTSLHQIPVLFQHGARPEVHLAITHPVLLPAALRQLDAEWLAELVVTDTIVVPPPKQHPKLKIVSVAPMLAYAIRGIYRGESITALWDPDAARKLGFGQQ